MVKNKALILTAAGSLILGICLAAVISTVYTVSSTNDSCMACHVHPDAEASWKQGPHHLNESGVVTDCAACHLPPQSDVTAHFFAKTKIGIRDIWSFIFKDKSRIDWESRRDFEHARHYVYNESCVACHADLFPKGLSDDGISAHLYYEENREKLGLECISCHLDAGHYNPGYSHSRMVGVPAGAKPTGPLYTEAATLDRFADFTETVPGTHAALRMIAVPGGSFTIGSPEKEAFRNEDEGPRKEVRISPFFMGEVEVTWDQYWAFYAETMSEGRTAPEKIYANNSRPDVDAVSGPTPPFGNPDQGWGMGERPALTMTHYGAETFCQWLSLKTGRRYRLPTEAEWEYAARGGTDGAYFFEGDPRKYSSETFWHKIAKADTSVIGGFAVYALNSRNRTQEPSSVKANPFGLKNMLGNVMEYCSDWYAEDAYSMIQDGQLDPKGPAQGKEHVVRGGLYSDDAGSLRVAARAHTMHDDWLKTDPQLPKSIWWYSDVKGIGFRVVCEVPENIITN